MWQMYSCPNCGSPVADGVRFCGNCGSDLSNLAQRLLPSSAAVSHAHQYLNQPQNQIQQRQVYIRQTGWSQQPGHNQPAHSNQIPMCGTQKQQQRQEIARNRAVISQRQGSSVEAAAKPIRSEIIKLMSDLFDKQIKRN
jgi:hypothetical protein